jgi:hypothetical protein
MLVVVILLNSILVTALLVDVVSMIAPVFIAAVEGLLLAKLTVTVALVQVVLIGLDRIRAMLFEPVLPKLVVIKLISPMPIPPSSSSQIIISPGRFWSCTLSSSSSSSRSPSSPENLRS